MPGELDAATTPHGYVSTRRSIEPAQQRLCAWPPRRTAATTGQERAGVCDRGTSLWAVPLWVALARTDCTVRDRWTRRRRPAGQEQLAFGVWTSWRLRFYCVAANTRQWRTPSTWRSIISITSSISGHTGQYHAVYMIAYACGCSLSHVRYRSTYLKCNKMHYSLFKMLETLPLQPWD